MFLRFGQVVGQSGVISAVLIVLLSKLITTLTALSLSAIFTNTRVKGAGAYYLISRSLGVEFGGAIGIVFFLAQAISVAMYVIGFTEAFLDTFPQVALSSTVVATLVNLAVFICVFIGAGWTIKVQYGILMMLALSLISFYIGAFQAARGATLFANLQPHYLEHQNFFTMFALFFPAATGIMAGANMSGDLKDPGRAIPQGTLAAIGVTALIYLSQVFFFASARSHDELIANPLIIKDIAWSSLLITMGIFAATLSSALGSMMGASRILQAFARDDIFKRLKFFSVGRGPNNEPRRATVLTFLIAQTGILLGDLNAIAPIITMFFMITYGTLNLATFYEAITRNPSYRPRFRFSHWSTALLGAIGCAGAMFLITPLWATVSVVTMAGLYWYISRREIKARWGDVRSGVAFERARKSLLKLEDERYHPKNWRPTILAFSGGAWSRLPLAVYGHWLTAGHGILTLAQVITGELEELLTRRANQEKILRDFIEEQELSAFPAVVVAPTLVEGMQALVQCHGLGGFQPNTVLIGWSDDPERSVVFGSLLRTLLALNRSIVILRCEEEDQDPWIAPPGSVDVWWRGKKNGALMLLLAHLLIQNTAWRTRNIRLLRVIPAEAGREETT